MLSPPFLYSIKKLNSKFFRKVMLLDQEDVQSGCAFPHTVKSELDKAGVPTMVVGATPWRIRKVPKAVPNAPVVYEGIPSLVISTSFFHHNKREVHLIFSFWMMVPAKLNSIPLFLISASLLMVLTTPVAGERFRGCRLSLVVLM